MPHVHVKNYKTTATVNSLLSLFVDLKENNMKKLEGTKTYAGLIIAVLGILGVGDIISETEVAELINAIVTAVGIIAATYGRYDAGRRLRRASGGTSSE